MDILSKCPLIAPIQKLEKGTRIVRLNKDAADKINTIVLRGGDG